MASVNRRKFLKVGAVFALSALVPVAAIAQRSAKILVLDDGASSPALLARLSAHGFNVSTVDFSQMGIDLGELAQFDALIINLHLRRYERDCLLSTLSWVSVPVFEV